MEVKVLVSLGYNGIVYHAGEILVINRLDGERLIAEKKALPIAPAPPGGIEYVFNGIGLKTIERFTRGS